MSSFGKLLRITTFGESHCVGVGGILEGFPSKYHVNLEKVQEQLDRRRAKGHISTTRQESDTMIILSGMENGITLGTPIGFLVKNKDIKPEDYHQSQGIGDKYIPRPSHADYSYLHKYGIHASSGGGRSSARETISRVIGGAIAEQYLESEYNCKIVAWVNQIGEIKISERYREMDKKLLDRKSIDASLVRCPDLELTKKMVKMIEECKERGDSVGGIITVNVFNPPIGLGEPCFDKLEALLAHAMLSIPATKGFEIGTGFSVGEKYGSQNNDLFTFKDNRVKPLTNNAGGTLGGISNGETISFRVAFKPPSTISLPQETVNIKGEKVTLRAEGRHDPCIVHRAVPIVEAMTALTILDTTLCQKTNLHK
jgi:chorismate synthase